MYLPVFLSVAVVEESELIWVCYRWRVDLFFLTSATTWKQKQINTPPITTQINSDSSTIATDNSTSTYIIHYSVDLIAFSAEYTLLNYCNFNLVYYPLSVNLILSFKCVTRRCSYSCVLLTMGDCIARKV